MRASPNARPAATATGDVAAILGSSLVVRAVAGGVYALRREYSERGDYRMPVTLQEFRDRREAKIAIQRWHRLDDKVLQAARAIQR